MKTSMDPKKTDSVLRTLADLSTKQDLTILALSDPISNALPIEPISPAPRTSDASTTSQSRDSTSAASPTTTTPASLEADLAHYRELFSKLRFSYVEQVTKEKFIKSIVGDPPLIVTPQENLEFEKQNVKAKAQLKGLKNEVAEMVEELEKKAKELSKRHQGIEMETQELRELPALIGDMEVRIAELRQGQEPRNAEKPELSLPLSKTLEVLEERKAKKLEMDVQLEKLRAQVPRKRKEVERLQAELTLLEAKRSNNVNAAKEAKRRRAQALGGVEDNLEERGRWYRASEAALLAMLKV